MAAEVTVPSASLALRAALPALPKLTWQTRRAADHDRLIDRAAAGEYR